jgi:hypothetical protein
MVWEIAAAAGISALGSIIGGKKQSDAAKDAAAAQSDAANRQIDLYQDIYNDQRMLQQPYYQMGLQGMYGPSGLSNLLGVTTPAAYSGVQYQEPRAQPAQPQNAFSQFASGSYGTQSPAQQREAAAQQQTDQYQAYMDANPDLMQHYSNNNVANSPHLLGGGGAGADLDGDGTISPAEFGRYHYNTHGRSEGRALPASNALSPSAGGANPGVVAVGDGLYMPGGNQQPVIEAGPAPTQPVGKEIAPEAPAEGPMTQTLRQTPGYMFLQDEARRMREGSAAARGELLSGGAIAEADRQVMGLADQTYQQSVNNNFQLANLGMGAAAQISNAGNYFANGAGGALGSIGNAQAGRAYGQANAFNAGLQGVTDAVGYGLGNGGFFGGSRDQSFTFNQNGGNQTGWRSN